MFLVLFFLDSRNVNFAGILFWFISILIFVHLLHKLKEQVFAVGRRSP